MQRYAAIDVGCNSVLINIAEKDEEGALKTLLGRKKGTGYFLMERLNNGLVSSAREWPWPSHKEGMSETA